MTGLFKTFARGLFFATFLILSGCALFQHGGDYSIEQTATGYVVQGLPSEILEQFPGSHRIEVALENPDGSKSSVQGMAVRSGTGGLTIETDGRLQFLPEQGATWLLLRSREGTARPDVWSGCPRDPTLRVWKRTKICWCWADAGIES